MSFRIYPKEAATPWAPPPNPQSVRKRENSHEDHLDKKRIKTSQELEKIAFGGLPIKPYTGGRYHYIEHEEIPAQKVNSSRHRRALREIPSIIRESVLPTLSLFAGEDCELDYIIEWFKKSANIPPSEPISIALIGNPASGKSFTLNNITGEPGLAHSGGDTDSVTQVPQVFAHEYSPVKYSVMVYFLSKDSVQLLINDCFEHLIKHVETHDEDEDRDEDDEISNNAKASQQALEDLFKPLELPGLDDIGDWLRENSFLPNEGSDSDSADRGLAIGKFVEAVLKRATEEGGLDFSKGKKTITASNLGELHAKTELFSGRGGLAPIVTHIRTKFDSPLLKQGMELVDLPGFEDLNIYRRKKAMDYFDKCSRALVVHEIERAMAKPDLSRLLVHAIKKKGAENICLLLRGRESVSLSTHGFNANEKAHLEMLQRKHTEAQKSMEIIKSAKNPGPEPTAIGEAASNIKRLELQILEHRLEVQDRLLNNHFSQKKYRDRRSDGVLTVKTISNTDYQRYVLGEPRTKLSVQATGIPGLRDFLCKGPSEIGIQKFNYHRKTLVRQLQRVRVWADSTELTRRDDVMSLFESGAKLTADKHLAELVKATKDMQRAVIHLMSSSWTDDLSVTIDGWTKYYAAQTLAAFFKNGGRHMARPKAVKDTPRQAKRTVSWTAELISTVENDLIDLEKSRLRHAVDVTGAKINEEILVAMEDLRIRLEQLEAIGGTKLESVFGMFDGECDACVTDVADYREQLSSSIRIAIVQATYDENCDARPSPAIVKEMKKLYASALETIPMGTKNATNKRLKYLKANVARPGGPFQKMAEEIHANLKKLFKDWIAKVNKRIEAMFGDLQDALLRSFDGKRMSMERKAEVGPRIKEVVLKAIEDLEAL